MSTKGFKVTYQDGRFYQCGEVVGRLDGGRGEWYVMLAKPFTDKFVTVARFKYANAKPAAKDWVKYVLETEGLAATVEALEPKAYVPGVEQMSPLGFAKKTGYVDYNTRKYLKNQ